MMGCEELLLRIRFSKKLLSNRDKSCSFRCARYR